MSTAYSSKVKIVVSHWASKHARAAWMASYSFIAPAVPGAAVDSGSAVTDDCGAVEALGKVVFLVDGDEANIKITTPIDLILAEAILQARENEA